MSLHSEEIRRGSVVTVEDCESALGCEGKQGSDRQERALIIQAQ
jgi:hypothetical protein